MGANSLLIHRYKMQCNKFSGIILKGLKNTIQRMIKEMLYGIRALKDVKLSNYNLLIANTVTFQPLTSIYQLLHKMYIQLFIFLFKYKNL